MGLMLPLVRESVEPMAARVDAMHASTQHQALYHFVARLEWSGREMLCRVRQRVVPQMDLGRGSWWIIDDTGILKKGKHSMGLPRQHCGMLGKQDNHQSALSVSLVCVQSFLRRGGAICPRIGLRAWRVSNRPACSRSRALPRRRRSRWRTCASCWPREDQTIGCWPTQAMA